MRTARIVEEGAGYYHVISRVVGREKGAEKGQVNRGLWRAR